MPSGDFERNVVAERRALGEALRRMREDAGLTQQDAADRLGIAQSAISRYERGERGLEVGELTVIVKAYGRTVSELLGLGIQLLP